MLNKNCKNIVPVIVIDIDQPVEFSLNVFKSL